jgi:hypothetical protein
MTFTTASGLLPAGIAVYVQRELNGVRLEIQYLVRLQGFMSQSETNGLSRERPAWEIVQRLKTQRITFHGVHSEPPKTQQSRYRRSNLVLTRQKCGRTL